MNLRPETLEALKSSGVSEQQFIDALRVVFPHGHEDFLPTTIKELELHSVKNHDYAKGGAALGNFDRVSAILALYPGLNPGDRRVVALTYALKQLDAVLWGMAKNITHKVEGLRDRLQDISVYAKIVMCMVAEDARNESIDKQFGVDLHSHIGAAEAPNVGQRWGAEPVPGVPGVYVAKESSSIFKGRRDEQTEARVKEASDRSQPIRQGQLNRPESIPHVVGGCGMCRVDPDPTRDISSPHPDGWSNRGPSPYDLSAGDKGFSGLRNPRKDRT